MLTRTLNPTVHPGRATPVPWALYSWPPVFWQANSRQRPRFVHLATRVTSEGDHRRPRSGHTVWSGAAEDGDAGMAWDWIEIGRGLVAMADPLSVLTNMLLLNGDGNLMPSSEAALHINQFVRRLPWQNEVGRLLKTA